MQTKQDKRPRNCEILIDNEHDICSSCRQYDKKKFQKKFLLRSKKIKSPAQANAQLSNTHPERIRRKKFEAEVKELHEKIERIQCDGIEVNESMDSDKKESMDSDVENVSPFMKLFWEQQKVVFANNNVRKYHHPMIICFCLSLEAKSSSAYDELRDSKVLTLPSRRTLRDYRNAIRPSVGFNKAVIVELIITANPLKGHQMYVTLAFEEMKIKENLVFDKNTNELIGYVDII